MAFAPTAFETAVVARPVDLVGPPESAWLERVAALPPGQRWWLDSARVVAPLGRWSFAGAEPYGWLRCVGDRCELQLDRDLWGDGGAVGRHRWVEPAASALERLLPREPVEPIDLPFSGGAVVTLGYEWGRELDRFRLGPRTEPDVPDLCALFIDRLWAFDHLEGRLWAVGSGFAASGEQATENATSAARELAASPSKPWPRAAKRRDAGSALVETVTAADYAKGIATIGERITAGDLYQACLTRRRVHESDDEPWELYRRLRLANPAPFGAFLELPDHTVMGSSPERFLRVSTEGWAESRPIKGTRPRGQSPDEDQELRAELARSEKDRAENVMIVDLVRNDLGRVCEIGSVHVPELMTIESYATVFQMVSTVRGRLAPGRTAIDALCASFPPGSMTGAPKIAAMELLDELETAPRGLYAGALGYFDVGGGCDLSVVIRTAFARDGKLSFHTGGGIVADSKADEEWQESEDKLTVLLEALL